MFPPTAHIPFTCFLVSEKLHVHVSCSHGDTSPPILENEHPPKSPLNACSSQFKTRAASLILYRVHKDYNAS